MGVGDKIGLVGGNPRNATTADLRAFRHLNLYCLPCSSILYGYSPLPYAKICVNWGFTAPLPEVAGKLRYRKAPLWTFDYHTEKSELFCDVTPGLQCRLVTGRYFI